MKTINLNEMVQVKFTVPNNLKSFYSGILETNGVFFKIEDETLSTSTITLDPATFNEGFIGKLADIFCSK